MDAQVNVSAIPSRLRGFFGFFPMVKVIHARLEALLVHECSGEEPECLAIIGETGTGKTTLIKRFAAAHPRIEHEEYTEIPVLVASVPARCTVKMLVTLLLRSMGSPFWNRGDELERTAQLVTLIKACKVRLIILDEVNHLADRGAQKTHYHVGDWIKQLIEASNVPVVLAGTPAATILWRTNEQLADRYREVLTLAPMSMEPRNFKQFQGVLRAFASVMGTLPCIDLTEEAHAKRMAFATAGRLRDIRRLLVRAVELAALLPKPRITRATLCTAFLQVIYPKAPPSRNPFSGSFNEIPLTKEGEPFAPRREDRRRVDEAA